MPRTPRVVEDRREQIIDAAMRVFAQKGFTRATNKDIAREAGITAGLIYHYFESKEALLKVVAEERSPLSLFRALPPQALSAEPEVFVRFLLRQALSIAEGERFVQLIRVLLPEIIHNPEVAPISLTVFTKVLGFLTSYFAAYIERGQLRSVDPSFVAQALLSCTVGFVLRRQIIGDPTALQYTQEQLAEFIADMALNGLLPR